MDISVNTKPSVKKVREWPKVDILSFFVKARELIAERLGKGKKPYVPELGAVGKSVIKRDYTRLNINNSKKLEQFSKSTVVTSTAVKNDLNEKFIEKYSKNER